MEGSRVCKYSQGIVFDRLYSCECDCDRGEAALWFSETHQKDIGGVISQVD